MATVSFIANFDQGCPGESTSLDIPWPSTPLTLINVCPEGYTLAGDPKQKAESTATALCCKTHSGGHCPIIDGVAPERVQKINIDVNDEAQHYSNCIYSLPSFTTVAQLDKLRDFISRQNPNSRGADIATGYFCAHAGENTECLYSDQSICPRILSKGSEGDYCRSWHENIGTWPLPLETEISNISLPKQNSNGRQSLAELNLKAVIPPPSNNNWATWLVIILIILILLGVLYFLVWRPKQL